ncbi:MAG: heme-binding protein [Verrucomicrobia bacterium]|nr:heme-binding protein [Verrucomicrobiota bacterium]
MKHHLRYLLAAAFLASPALPLRAQTVTKPTITLELAKKIAVKAGAEAAKNKWNVVIAIVDDGGNLIYLEKMDGTQIGSIDVAQAKAKTALKFKRSTKVFEDVVAGGRTAILSLPGVVAVEGGLPLVVDGTYIGAIGVSGVKSNEDGVVAEAGASVLAQVKK